MSTIIDYLRRFNSKERFFLVGQILGNFTPSADFRKQLGDVLQLQIPETVFSAMDYHIDWLYASLEIAKSGEKLHNKDDKLIKAQQEDIDFIIAFDLDSVCHIILIEAKGVTGWMAEQMNSKVKRLREIFGADGKKWTEAQPHFVLMSPSQPERLNIENCPGWMKQGDSVKWIKLEIKDDFASLCVSRCDDKGKEDKNGKYWIAKKRRNKNKDLRDKRITIKLNS